jgi:pimeloyl-ACP methyl ester carboxylesterase
VGQAWQGRPAGGHFRPGFPRRRRRLPCRRDPGDARRRGVRLVQGDLSQTTTQGTYGNDTSVTRIGQLITFVQGASSPLQAAAGKVHILGVSGGATAAFNYARANPANVASLYLIAPAVDMLAIYNTPARLAFVSLTQAEMNKAYNNGVDDGGTAFLAAMPTHDPSATGNQAALSVSR